VIVSSFAVRVSSAKAENEFFIPEQSKGNISIPCING
jgi:hypothetical protein